MDSSLALAGTPTAQGRYRRKGCRGSGNLERLTVEGVDLGIDRDEGGLVEPGRDPVVIHFENDTNRDGFAWSSSQQAAHFAWLVERCRST